MKPIFNTDASKEELQELLSMRVHADYKGYLKLLEVMDQLKEKDQREVQAIKAEREALNDKMLDLMCVKK